MFSSLNIINVASSYLEQLNLILGETVNFSMRENDHAIMIYKLEPTTRHDAYPSLHRAAFTALLLSYGKTVYGL